MNERERYELGQQLFDAGWNYELGRWWLPGDRVGVNVAHNRGFTLERALELSGIYEA